MWVLCGYRSEGNGYQEEGGYIYISDDHSSAGSGLWLAVVVGAALLVPGLLLLIMTRSGWMAADALVGALKGLEPEEILGLASLGVLGGGASRAHEAVGGEVGSTL